MKKKLLAFGLAMTMLFNSSGFQTVAFAADEVQQVEAVQEKAETQSNTEEQKKSETQSNAETQSGTQENAETSKQEETKNNEEQKKSEEPVTVENQKSKAENKDATFSVSTQSTEESNKVAVQAEDAVIEVNGTPYASVDDWIDTGYVSNCSIKLLKDAELTKPLHLYGDVTIDLNGCSLTTSYDQVEMLRAENANGLKQNCNLTIKSSSNNGTIKIGRTWGHGTLFVASSASCTIESNVTIEDHTNTIAINNYGILTIKEGAIINNTNGELLRNSGGNTILEGGEYTGTIKAEAGTLTISGGTFNGKIKLTNGQTLQDCMNPGCTLKGQDGSAIDMDSKELNGSVKAEQAVVWFTTHPALEAEKAALLEGYAENETSTLTVAATGNGTDAITYQWHVKKTPKGGTISDEELSGATSSSYQIPTGLTAGTYEYYCVASCKGESVKSKSVTLTVTSGVVQTVIDGTKKSHVKLETALQEIEDAVASGTAQEITLTFMENLTSDSGAWTLDGTGKTTNLTIDLNGQNVTCSDFVFKQMNITLKDSKKSGDLQANLNMQEETKFKAWDVTFKRLMLESGATAEMKDTNTSDVVIGSTEGNTKAENETISCEIDGGTHKNIKVYGGAKLKIEGNAKITDTLQAIHSVGDIPVRANVELSGGDYAKIQVMTKDGGLEDTDNGYAISDMLAAGYAFYSLGIPMTVKRSETSYVNLSVCTSDTEEDTSKAVVKSIVTKKDESANTYYFAGWTETLNFLRQEQNADDWESVDIMLLQDEIVSKDEYEIKSGTLPADLAITIRSEGADRHTLTGGGGTGKVLELYGFHNVSILDIEIRNGWIDLLNTTLTLDGNAKISSDTNTICVHSSNAETGEGKLIVKNAEVAYTGETDSLYAVFLIDGELRLENENSIIKSTNSGYQVGFSSRNRIILGEKVSMPTIRENTEGSNLDIFCNNPSAETPGNGSQPGNAKIWYPITLPDGVSISQEDNPSTITIYENQLYGLGWTGDDSVDRTITVGENICSYQKVVDSKKQVVTDQKFTIPATAVTLLTHELDSSGYCANCGRTDLSVVYQNGNLQIDGLTGRTFDSWPQIMTGITLTMADGSTKTLKGPKYESGKELAQDSTDPANADLSSADYAVVYSNNINAYEKKQGESGFDAAKAPKVTIIGRGDYIGTVEYYFTIGQGTFKMTGFEATENVYDGYSRNAMKWGMISYKPDASDANAGITVTAGNIEVCSDKTVSTDGFDSVAKPKVAYTTDDGTTWTEIYENNMVTSEANYRIKDAGTYPFTVRVTNENCPAATQDFSAVIAPKSLNSDGMSLDSSQKITVYYTGKPIIPTGKDHSITNAHIVEGGSTSPYVLEKGKDFTTSAENNVSVTDNAILKFTGIGNYTGTLTDTFSIIYAFTLAQTTASKGHWYNTDVPAAFSVDDTTGNTAEAVSKLVYRNTKNADNTYNIELNDDVNLYATIQDALKGTNKYTFTNEGKQTVTLYGKDSARGYLSNPVDVTVQIDKSAPTWADKDGNTDGYGIQIKTDWWKTLLNKISFGHFYNKNNLNIQIQANDKKNGVDEVSGIDKYYYYVDTITDASDEQAAKTKVELDALAEQGKFESADAGVGKTAVHADGVSISGKLSNQGKYVVYAYAVDKAGNKSEYICTDGVVVDTTEPKINNVTSNPKDTETTISFNMSEDATLFYFYVDEGSFADKASYRTFVQGVSGYLFNQGDGYLPFAVKEDGKWKPAFTTNGEEMQVTSNPSETRPMYSKMLKAGDNEVTITGLKPGREGFIWMTAIDRAGNISGNCQMVWFQTTKGMPEITTLPEVSGVYGDAANTLRVTKTGVAKYQGEVIPGSWEVTGAGNELLKTGSTQKYQVTFTPDASYADIYESTTVEVTPTISKRPLKINVANSEKSYGEELPDITFSTGESLVKGDTLDEIKDTLTMKTKATKDSDVGEYSFTVVSDSDKYEVTAFYYNDLNHLDEETPRSEGTLHIVRAAGNIVTDSSFHDIEKVQYQPSGGYATFKLNITASYAGAKLKYDVIDAKNSLGQSVDADQILTVAEDGTVTLKGAGSAVIHISLPESKNYEEADNPQDVTIQISKGNIKVAESERSYSYNLNKDEKYDPVAENKLDLTRIGELTYGDIEVKINGKSADKAALEKFFESAPHWVTDSKTGKTYLNYQVKQLKKNTSDTAEIIMHVTGANCSVNGDDTITLKISRTEKQKENPEAKTDPTSNSKSGSKPEAKSSGSAKTGDAAIPMLYLAVMFVSGCAIFYLAGRKKKKK